MVKFKSRVVSTSSSSVFVGFLDQDKRYKSVATQISHDARLTPIYSVGDQTRNRCDTATDFVLVLPSENRIYDSSTICKNLTCVFCFHNSEIYIRQRFIVLILNVKWTYHPYINLGFK